MPGSITDTLFDRESVAIQELIGTAAMEILPAIEPSFRDMIWAGPGAVESWSGSQLGRDLRFKRRYFGAAVGAVRGGHLSNYANLYGDATRTAGSDMYSHTGTQTIPDPFASAVPKPFGLTGELHSIDTNLPLTRAQGNLDALPANIKAQTAPILRGFAMTLAMLFTTSWFANPDNQFRLASLGPSSGTGAYSINTTNKTITFQPVEKTIHKFVQGMPVDIFSNATTRRNEGAGAARIRLWVDSVDVWNNTVVLAADSGDATFDTWATTANLGSASFVVFMDSYSATHGFKGLYPWRAWAVWGGATDNDKRILRGQAITTTADDYIDVTQHPAFRSGHWANVGVLTERKWLQYAERMGIAGRAYGHVFNRCIASEGIWANMFEQYQTREVFDRGPTPGQTGGLRSMGRTGGVSLVGPDGQTYEGLTSGYLESGLMLCMAGAGNWGLLTPPRGDGASGAEGVSSENMPSGIPFRFTGKALGYHSNQIPVLRTLASAAGSLAQPTIDYTQMPGEICGQFVPLNQIPMVVLEDITTSRVYTDE